MGIDPLYRLGDKAEDQADVLNDRVGDAVDNIYKIVRNVTKRLRKHKLKVSKHVKDTLTQDAHVRHSALRHAKMLADRAAAHLSKLKATSRVLAASGMLHFGSFLGSAIIGSVAAFIAIGAKK